MKTNPHTKPPSHEGNPSQRSTPSISPLRASAPLREISLCVASFAPAHVALRAAFGRLPSQRPLARVPLSAFRSPVSSSPAFSLVELLVVMAIIGMMVGLSALAVSGMRAPAVQHAADQVMSGLSLARQIAITKNTQAALLIADKTSAGFPTNGPYRHWSVVYSNKDSSGDWTIAKDWEELPNGAFFLEILRESGNAAQTYNPLTTNKFTGYSVGQGFTPTNFPVLLFSKISAISGNTTTGVLTNQTIPCIIFTSSGTITNAGGITDNAGNAIRISAGNVMTGNATLTSTNQYYFVETDNRTGRIRMRSPESYYK